MAFISPNLPKQKAIAKIVFFLVVRNPSKKNAEIHIFRIFAKIVSLPTNIKISKNGLFLRH